jgi:putative sterol carrier protein
MSAIFPSEDWVNELCAKLNGDQRYAKIASNWEGDVVFDIEPSGALEQPTKIYLDLWHGKCRQAVLLNAEDDQAVAFNLQAPFDNFVRILLNELDPMQAMLTRKLKVKGSMAYMMRNVPVVLDFVRCAKEITQEVLVGDSK